MVSSKDVAKHAGVSQTTVSRVLNTPELVKPKTIEKVILYLPEQEDRCVGVISINVKGYLPDEVGRVLDEEFNICVRAGFHCSPLIHRILNTKEIGGTVRISVNYFNTIKDIDNLIDALKTF